MNAEQWRRVDDLLQAALTHPPPERHRFVATTCAGDDSLFREVTSLLIAHDQDGLLDARVSAIAADLLAPQPRRPLARGASVGPYRVVERLGSGGMSDVYVAEDTRLARKVALKVLDAPAHDEPSRVARFMLEARAASALNHPNIATVYDVGSVDGRHYIATELVEGQTLRTRLHETIPMVEAVDIARQLATGLAAAHGSGIVHRDIKPENVVIRSDGVVKIVDFGLAKLVVPHGPATSTHDTLPGMILGTTLYMSPEQAQGMEVDARSDIFSLGVVIFEMIAGGPPFSGRTIGDAIASVLRDEPSTLSDRSGVPSPELDRIVSKALRKAPNERYQRVDDLLVDLHRLSPTPASSTRRSVAIAVAFAAVVTTLIWGSSTLPSPAIAKRDGAEVHQLYVKGRFFWNKRTVAALETSVRYFEQATKMDPTYAPAFAGLADAYLALTGNPGASKPPHAYLPPARQAALHAIRLQPTNVDARVILAAIRHAGDWDWIGAEREFKEALAMGPEYAPAHHRYGVYLAFMRRFDEAIAALTRAEQLDPVSVAISTDLGMVYNFARQPDRAIPQLQKALEIDPAFARARFNLAEAYAQKGLFAQAADVIDDRAPGVPRGLGDRIVMNRIRILAGEPPETAAILADALKQPYVAAIFVAELYALLGQDDDAFRWLDQAYEDGGALVLRLYCDPQWERYRIHSDPRFAALLRRIGLPERTNTTAAIR